MVSDLETKSQAANFQFGHSDLPSTGIRSGMVTRIGPKRPFQLFIKEWIEFKQLDQQRVAERMGCEPGTLSKLISGKMRRTDEWLAAIAYALDIDVVDLFRDPERPSPADLLRDISPEDQERVVRVIRAMTGT